MALLLIYPSKKYCFKQVMLQKNSIEIQFHLVNSMILFDHIKTLIQKKYLHNPSLLGIKKAPIVLFSFFKRRQSL
tara:strand:+ start:330 stop:554 length:225 start_codon:yes stop_codon:yes gene_type:complete